MYYIIHSTPGSSKTSLAEAVSKRLSEAVLLPLVYSPSAVFSWFWLECTGGWPERWSWIIYNLLYADILCTLLTSALLLDQAWFLYWKSCPLSSSAHPHIVFFRLFPTQVDLPFCCFLLLFCFSPFSQFSSVAQSCPTLCNPMDCSMPGLPVHHQLPEFTQTHVHRVSDAIQPSHPLSSPSPPALNPSQHQGLFTWVSSSHQVTKVLEFQLQHQSFKWTFRTYFP